MIDFTKSVQTRAGEPVRILCTDMKNTSYPVIGLVTGKFGKEHLFAWGSNGQVLIDNETDGDLVNVPEKRTVACTLFYAAIKVSGNDDIRTFLSVCADQDKYLRSALSVDGWRILLEETIVREVTL